MVDEDRRRFDEMLTMQKETLVQVSDISRAIYGDEKNKVPGLLERQSADEADIQKLKDAKKKFVWIASGILIAINGLMHFKDLVGIVKNLF